MTKMKVVPDKELRADIASPYDFLAVLAKSVYKARRPDGGRVRDVSDVKEWLVGLEEKARKAKTWDEFVRIGGLEP